MLKYRKWLENWKNELGDYYKDDDQVFSHPNGDRITTPVFNNWFKRVRDKAGLPDYFSCPPLRNIIISLVIK